MIKEMTSGNPLKLILWFSLPVLLGNIFQQVYLLSDLIVVGRMLGVSALAALGTSMPIYAMIMMITFGFTNGLSIIPAQRLGAKNYEGIAHSFAVGLVLCLIASGIVTIAGAFLLPSVMQFMNIPDDIFDEALGYVNILIYGSIAMVFYNYLANLLRALGDSKTPLYFLIYSCVLNVILNITLIAVFHTGVKGPAIASVISQISTVILCFWLIRRKYPILTLHRHHFRLSSEQIVAHLKLSLPMVVQFAVIGLGALIVQSACNTFGSTIIAAMATGIRVDQFATIPLLSLSAGIVTFTAQNYGAHYMRRIRQGIFQISCFSFVLSILLAVLCYTFGDDIIAMFLKDKDAQVIKHAHMYLKVTTLFYFCLGQIFVFRQSLIGMGHTVMPTISCLVELIVRLIIVFGFVDTWGFYGLCYAIPAGWGVGFIVLIVGYIYALHTHTYRRTQMEQRTWWPKSLFVSKLK